jgi:putative DNA primase/helicase
MGELAATFNKSELSHLKDFLTQENDVLRLPYAKTDASYPRRTVFAATVNRKDFLLDDTGNTRWWVVECVSVDYRHKVDMQQVWAEVYETLYKSGEQWWLTRDEELRLEAQNREYRIYSVVADLLSRRLNWKEPRIFWTWRTTTEALLECGIDKPTPGDVQKGAKFIKEMTGMDSVRSGHNRSRVYLLPPADKHPRPEEIDMEESNMNE